MCGMNEAKWGRQLSHSVPHDLDNFHKVTTLEQVIDLPQHLCFRQRHVIHGGYGFEFLAAPYIYMGFKNDGPLLIALGCGGPQCPQIIPQAEVNDLGEDLNDWMD
jgi:hypothetical protein